MAELIKELSSKEESNLNRELKHHILAVYGDGHRVTSTGKIKDGMLTMRTNYGAFEHSIRKQS